MGPLLLLKVSVILTVTLVAARLLHRAPARARHGLWSLAFGSLLLLAPLAALLPALYVPMPAGWELAPPAPTTSTLVSSSVTQLDAPASGSVSTPTEVVNAVEPSSAPQPAVRAGGWPSVSTILFGAWLAGMVAAAATVLIALYGVRRLIRSAQTVSDPAWQDAAITIGTQLGLRHPVPLLLSPRVGTPMAGGAWRPAIFLPMGAVSWSTEHRDMVLAHELAHLAGHDPLRHLMTRAALACYWFHPLAWLAAREAAIAREQACDETVIALGVRPSAYARVLLDLAESLSVRPAARFLGALPMVHPSHLEKRLMAILNVDARRSARRFLVGPAVGVVLLTLSVAAAQPFDTVQESAFDQGQGRPVGVVAGTPLGVVGGVPSGIVEGVPVGVVGGVPVGVVEGLPVGVVAGLPLGMVADALAGVTESTPVAGTLGGQDSACASESGSGGFVGTRSSTDIGGRTVVTDQVGWRDGDRIIQRSFGDLRVCMLAEGVGVRNTAERPSQWLGRARRVVMEAHRGSAVQRLELTGSRTSWQVDGSTRDFNPAAQTWRDRMLAVLDITWEVSSLRGEDSDLRGQISTLQGQRSSLQGEISALEGAASTMQGRVSSASGEESRLSGEISAIRAHVSALQMKIYAEQSAISRLRVRPYRNPFQPIYSAGGVNETLIDQVDRNRLDTQIADHEFAIARIEREIREYGAERRIAAVQKQIDAFLANRRSAEDEIRDFDLGTKVAAVRQRIAALDVDGRVAGIERQIQQLDADRRASQLEGRLDAELARLTAAMSAIR